MLHSLITHNDFLAKYDWNLNDLFGLKSSIEKIRELTELNSDDLFKAYLNDTIYSSRTYNKIDYLHVKKLINQIVFEKRYDMNQFVENSHKFYSKIGKSTESK